jgi:signal transduction histidine kinase
LQERVAAGIAQLASLALEHARTVEALERASRLKSEFVATMSHELRTPLNVILGYHALLLEGAWGTLSSEQHEVLRRAENSAGELLELITETLDLSRLESGRMALDLADVSLAGLVADLEAETLSLWDRPGLTTTFEVADDLPLLRTDPLKLKVVLKNLITNALKFTENGSVRLAATRTADGVEIAVSDSGPGIAPAALAIIFDPFRQADGSTTRRHGGVGLGLYIVRRLLELLGGSVQVESELGVGSTFRVRVPLRLET